MTGSEPVSIAPQAAGRSSLLQTVRDALNGSHQDYTQGSIGRALLLLAIPMVLEMALESVFAVTDVFFVGKLGANAVATVGLTESFLTIIYSMAMGISIGVSAIVARRIGENDPDDAARSAVQAVWLGLAIAIVLGVTGSLLAPRLLALLGASPAVLATGTTFARIMLGGEVSIIMLFIVNASLRGAGDAAIAMRVLWLANGINIVLDPLLIFGVGPFPHLGVTGAAIATTTGRTIGALFALSRLVRSSGRLHVERKHLRLDLSVLRRIISLASSATFQMLIGTASWIGLVRIMSTFGSQALAGYTIGVRVIIFALLPAWGICNAAATMVGQALGAKNPDRAERSVWMAARYNAFVLGIIGLLFVVFADAITAIFTNDPTVHTYATNCLRIASFGFPLFAFGGVITQSFNGAGDTWTPTTLNFIVFWLFEIPLAYLLAHPMHLGPNGIFYAIAVVFSVLAFVSAIIFRRGTWKTQVV
ncbi:MAG TPA: MATE family efflux transporter [Gemmatimonadaceae bacterium]|jgi:putative MATE family efflux protein|nr:MATE family efflux transporter [Gemmatimonadaceae bacterium]